MTHFGERKLSVCDGWFAGFYTGGFSPSCGVLKGTFERTFVIVDVKWLEEKQNITKKMW